jgi:uncharacterized protein YbjT (DUF2867 family)
MMKKIMVAGATGYIGGNVMRVLKAKGYRVRALSRSASKLRVPDDADEVFIGQATEPATIKGLCDGADAAFSSIGVHNIRQRKPSIWEVDYQANINILEEAKRAGVKHFIFVSTLRGPEMAESSPIAAARERVAEAVMKSGMNYTIYRPTGYFNDMAYVFEGVARKHKANLYGNPAVIMNPLHGLDFGDEVARGLEDPKCLNVVRSVGGPEVVTRRQCTEMCFEVLGLPKKISYKPIWQFKMVTNLIRPFNHNLFSVFRFLVFAFTTPDMTGEPIGSRKLRDYFEELAKKYKQ